MVILNTLHYAIIHENNDIFTNEYANLLKNLTSIRLRTNDNVDQGCAIHRRLVFFPVTSSDNVAYVHQGTYDVPYVFIRDRCNHRIPAVQLVRLETYNNMYYNLASVLTVSTVWYISWSKLTVQQWMWNKNNCPAGCALAKLSRPLKGVDFRFLPLVLRLNNFSYFSLRKIIKHRYHATERPFPNEHVYYNFCR